MLDEVLTLLLVRMNSVKTIDTSCHIEPLPLKTTEKDLLLDKRYRKGLASDYVPDQGERELGLRALKNPTDGTYNCMRLRLGKTVLHIKDYYKKTNIGAIVLTYMGDTREEKLSFGVTAYKLSAAGTVCILENGVIAASYCDMRLERALSLTWYAGNDSHLAAYPYPTTPVEVRKLLTQLADRFEIPTDTKAFKALPDLVMLATEVCRTLH